MIALSQVDWTLVLSAIRDGGTSFVVIVYLVHLLIQRKRRNGHDVPSVEMLAARIEALGLSVEMRTDALSLLVSHVEEEVKLLRGHIDDRVNPLVQRTLGDTQELRSRVTNLEGDVHELRRRAP